MVDLINFYVNSKITKIENQNKIFKNIKYISQLSIIKMVILLSLNLLE